MKKLLSLLLTITILFSFAKKAEAKVVVDQKGVVEVKNGELVDDDLFIGAETVIIAGIVNGDIYAGGGSVTINGVVNGSVHIGAGKVDLSGKVRDNVYIGAGNVSINDADIGGSLHIGSGNVNIDKGSKIGGSLIAGAGNITIDAPVGRNLLIGAGSIGLNSSVGGEARIASGDINLGERLTVGKELYYLADDNTRLRVAETASVSGGIIKVAPDNRFREQAAAGRENTRRALRSLSLAWRLVSFVSALLIGLILLYLFPAFFNRLQKFASSDIGKNTAAGFLASLLVFPLALFLFLTVIGIPLSLLLIVLFAISAYMAKLAASFCIGVYAAGKMKRQKLSVYIIFALGLFITYLIRSIPYIGFLFGLFITWWGTGSLFRYFIKTYKSNAGKGI